MKSGRIVAALALVTICAVATFLWISGSGDRWTEREQAILHSLWLGQLPKIPAAASNRVADDPRAVALGHRLFFDKRLSADDQISCASCHQPEFYFTDDRRHAIGIEPLTINTPTVVGAAWSPWQFRDGRKDSLWSQALEPLEHPAEHGATRVDYAQVIVRHYRDEYEALFGALPDLVGEGAESDTVTGVFVNIGKVIAAYQRRLVPGRSRFDRYVEAVVAGDEAAMDVELSADAQSGLRLFIGKAGCTQCHNGPLLTNNDFHNIGVATGEDDAHVGRVQGVRKLLADPFNCAGRWSDARPGQCRELKFLKREGDELLGARRVPSLRNVAATAPYMSHGRLTDLRQVLEHYNQAVDLSLVGHSDLEPLDLGEAELNQLEAFLRSLDGGIDAPVELLKAPEA